MLSLNTKFLALAALATTALSAPTTPLSARADYSPVTDDDYCGEAAVLHYSYGNSAPLSSDCTKLYQSNPGPGRWAISTAETQSRKASADGWTRLAASGTCAFEVRLAQPDVVDYQFGTNDLRFYVRGYAGEGQAQDGRVSASSTVLCGRDQGGQAAVEWRVAHA